MLFNSLSFVAFFLIVVPTYFLLPHRYRWAWLLAASCFFYMQFIPAYILILGITITIDYFTGLFMEARPEKKRTLLITSTIANVGMLFVFKYFNFANQNIAELAQFLGWNYSWEGLKLLLPLGLSFHTFQSLSYTIEVYRGNQKAEKHFGIFALYVLFFPQLVAGPIERPQNLLHQFHEKHFFDWPRIQSGLERMLLGFFKKVFIADTLALFADQVYNHATDYSGISIVIATVFFAFQIYCDFSGYSDIALGSAKVLGFTLMENFDAPYLSRSIAEFWRRWHISLSTWFKDYVYFPLGGSRTSPHRHVLNLLLTFLLSGIWHGANWTFVAWGLLNGIYLSAGALTKGIRERLIPSSQNPAWKALHITTQTLFTFSLICLSWIFFRANTLTQSLTLLKSLGQGWNGLLANLSKPEFVSKEIFLGLSENTFQWGVAGILILISFEIIQRTPAIKAFFNTERPYVYTLTKWLLISTALLLIIIFSRSESQQFIYFQF